MPYTTDFDILNAVAAAGGNTDQLNVTIASSSLPAGAATSAKQDTGNTSLSSIDTKLTSQATAANQTTGNTSLSSIDTKTPALGQAVMASSRPVVIASNQSTINTTTPDNTNLSQNITALNQTVSVSTAGMGSVIADITGGWTGTLTFQGTLDGSTWFSWVGLSNAALNSASAITNIVSRDQYLFPTAGIQQFRVKATAWTSGTATINLAASQGFSGQVIPFPAFPNTLGAMPGNTTYLNGAAISMGSGASDTGTQRVMLASTAALAANQSVNVAQINGVTPLMGGGNTGTGSHRVTLATDQAVLTNAWKSNVAQINGVAPLMGNGVTGTGSQRVTIASDTTSNTNPFLFNQSQMNGVALLAGNGVTGTGSQRVTISSDNTAFSVNAAITDGTKTTYSAAALGIASAVAATDIFTITGTASKTVRVTRVGISGTQTTAGEIDIQLIKRSAADTNGTPVAATVVPHDSSDAAGTATVNSYTANPTLGAALAAIRVVKLFAPAVASAAVPGVIEFDFGNGPSKAVVLRGTAQVLAVNLNATTILGGSFDCYVEWTEE